MRSAPFRDPFRKRAAVLRATGSGLSSYPPPRVKPTRRPVERHPVSWAVRDKDIDKKPPDPQPVLVHSPATLPFKDREPQSLVSDLMMTFPSRGRTRILHVESRSSDPVKIKGRRLCTRIARNTKVKRQVPTLIKTCVLNLCLDHSLSLSKLNIYFSKAAN